MNRRLDIAEVDAALQRAAYRALHGTRAERSGRFLPAKQREASSTNRVSKRADVNRREA
jgi:hypothetical protein